MHPAFAGVGLCAVRCGGLVDHSLLHDCAVHSEAVGGGSLGISGGGGSDECFQDGALRSRLVCGCELRTLVDVDVVMEMEVEMAVDVGMGAYNDGGVPLADFLVLVFGGILQCGVASLSICEFGVHFALAGAAGHTSVVILVSSGTGRG